MTPSDKVLDARGLLCPWPVLRVSRAAREIRTGTIRILADDPAAENEIAELCRYRGWSFRIDEEGSQAYTITID